MQRIPVICSFSSAENENTLKPLFFGLDTGSGRQRIRVDSVLRVFRENGEKTGYFGDTLQYLDKMVFECSCVVRDAERIVRLIYDPMKLEWYLEMNI